MKDDLRWNKIFGAILATGLAIMLLRVGSEMLFAPKAPAKPGYAVAIPESAGGGEGEAADTPPDWGTVLPTADVAAGATVANKCKSCHNFDNGGPDQTGPNLWGVIGRKPGSHPGFAYSSAMTDFGAKTPVWDYEHIYAFLKGPQAYIAGTKMSFVGLKKPEDRVALIGWLRQQSSSPVPIPPPNPAAAAGKAPASAAAKAGTDAKAPAPSAAAGVSANANTTSAGKPAAVGGPAPTSTVGGEQSSVAPTTGAAQAPSAVNDSPGGKSPSEGAEKASRKKQ